MSDRPLGVCLDIDGTLYREGSVFVETLARLPFAPDHSFSHRDRVRLRRAVSAVGRYQGGPTTAWRWRASLLAIDALARVAGAGTARSAIHRLESLESRLRAARPEDESTATGAGAYETMREAVLGHYGHAIAGHRRRALTGAVQGLLRQRAAIDPGTAAVLDAVDRDRIDVALVTDMPTHVAQSVSAEAVGFPVTAVVGTAFPTDGSGRFTGRFEGYEKRDALLELRAEHGWAHVIAAGDSRRDLPMAKAADRFIAVAGQGNIRAALGEPRVVDPGGDRPARSGEGSPIYVPPEQDLGTVLGALLNGVDP